MIFFSNPCASLFPDASNKSGIVHLKTDSPNLFLFTLKVIELYGLNLVYKSDDLYAEATIDPRCLIKTYYEGKDIAQSNKIHYIQFTLDKDLPLSLDEVLKEAIKDIPMEYIVLETDAPYLAPVPYRGKTNEPAYMIEVAKKLAEIKSLPLHEVAAITTSNAEKLFEL